MPIWEKVELDFWNKGSSSTVKWLGADVCDWAASKGGSDLSAPPVGLTSVVVGSVGGVETLSTLDCSVVGFSAGAFEGLRGVRPNSDWEAREESYMLCILGRGIESCLGRGEIGWACQDGVKTGAVGEG